MIPAIPEVVRNLWVLNPDIGARQAIALVIAWLHGCLGIYFWLRPKPWFPRAALLLYTGAILVPVLALLGFAEAGRDIAEAPERFGQHPAAAPAGFLPMAGPVLYALFGGLLAAYGGRPASSAADCCGRGGCGSPIPTIRSPPCRSASACWRPAASPAFRISPSAAGAGAAPPAGSGCSKATRASRRRPPRSAARSRASRPVPMCGSPASSGRPTTCPSCRSCRRAATA